MAFANAISWVTICVGVVLLELDVGIILFQIRFSGRAGDDNDFVLRADFIQAGDHCAVRGDNAQRHVHVGERKVHFLGAFLRYCGCCFTIRNLSTKKPGLL